jgi:hypothetical protein
MARRRALQPPVTSSDITIAPIDSQGIYPACIIRRQHRPNRIMECVTTMSRVLAFQPLQGVDVIGKTGLRARSTALRYIDGPWHTVKLLVGRMERHHVIWGSGR